MKKESSHFHDAAGTKNHGMYGNMTRSLTSAAISGGKKVVQVIGKLGDSYVNKLRTMDEARNMRNMQILQSQGLTPDAYEKMNPTKRK